MSNRRLNTTGKRILFLRNDNDWSLEVLASKMEPYYGKLISTGYLSSVEKGQKQPGASVIRALSKAFNVSSDYLLLLSDTEHPLTRESSFLFPESDEAGEIVDKMSLEYRAEALAAIKALRKKELSDVEQKRRIAEAMALAQTRGGAELVAKIERALGVRAPATNDGGLIEIEDGESSNNVDQATQI